MPNIKNLEKEIAEIKESNKRVEVDKAWETSKTRKLIILVLTYIVISVFFLFMKLPDPFINSIVPALGFVLSTLTVPIFKKLWIKNIYKK